MQRRWFEYRVLSFLLLLAWPTAWPAVANSQEITREIAPLSAPIERVTVYSQEALVERSADLALKPGVSRFELGLPASLVLESLDLRADGAKLVSVEVEQMSGDGGSNPEAETMSAELDLLRKRQNVLLGQGNVLNREIALLSNLQIAAGQEGAEARKDAKLSELAPGHWVEMVDWVSKRLKEAGQRMLANETERVDNARLITLKEQQLADLGGPAGVGGRMVVTLQADKATRVDLRISYRFQGSRWVPSYDVRLNDDGQSLDLSMAAMMQQESGSLWEAVQLRFSAARAGSSSAAPKQMPWKVERSVKAVVVPPEQVDELIGGSVPAGQELGWIEEADESKPWDASKPSRPVGEGGADPYADPYGYGGDPYGNQPADPYSDDPYGAEGPNGRGEGADPYGEGVDPYGDGSDAYGSDPYGDDPYGAEDPYGDGSDAYGSDPYGDDPYGYGSDPYGDDPYGYGSDPYGYGGYGGYGETGFTSDWELFSDPEQARATLSGEYGYPDFSRSAPGPDPNSMSAWAGLAAGTEAWWSWSPAENSGGEPLYFDALNLHSVAGNGEILRAPLSRLDLPVETRLHAAPLLDQRVFRTASVTNARNEALLAGPVQVFEGEHFLGSVPVSTSRPGAPFTLPLGPDPNLSATRTEEVNEGRTGSKISRQALVKIRLTNRSDQARTVLLLDRIPSPINEKLDIAYQPGAQPATPDAQGLLEWTIDVPANGETLIEFGYTLKWPKKFRIQEGM